MDTFTPEIARQERERDIVLLAAMKDLPFPQLEVIFLRYLDDDEHERTNREIADMLGIVESAVEKRLQRALAGMRQALAVRGVHQLGDLL